MPEYSDLILDHDFILSLQKGEDSGYELLCDRYSAMLFGIICRIVNDETDAENLLQDCYVKIWRNINNYDASKGRFATWLINIARNTAIDFTRSRFYTQKQKNQKLENFVGSALDISNRSFNSDTIGLYQVVESLPPSQREIIEWMYFKGYTQQEIADEFLIPLGTVKTRTRLALIELRQHFIIDGR